jgi:hypothetical protein
VVTLRRGSAGTDDGGLVAVARSLVALHDWTFLLGPGLVIGVNSLLLAVLVYRSGLVPRWIAVAATEGARAGQGCDEQFEFEFALDLLLDGFDRLRQQGWSSARAR